MDQVVVIILAAAGGVVLAVVLLVMFAKPFRAIRRSGDDHEAGAWTWMGADHWHDGRTDHGGESGGDGSGGD